MWRVISIVGSLWLAMSGLAVSAAAQPVELGRVPDGLSASDWASIRAVYEANRRVHQAEDDELFASDEGDPAGNRSTFCPPAQQAYLKPSNTDAGDFFGSPVAVSGDTVVVGARLEDSSATGVNGNQADNSASDSGAVYVFVRSGGVWSQEAYLKASNTGVADLFGSAVAVSGDTVVVGASGEDSNAMGVNGNQAGDNATNSGAAYVFVRSGGVWSQQAYLKASNTGVADSFGSSVAVNGDTVVVGAIGEASNATGINGIQTNNSASGSGAAYVFVRSGGVWSQQAYLKASNTGAGDQFGWSVAVSADTVVVAADLEDSSATGVNGNQADNNAMNSGAAYVFVRSGGIWSQQAYIKASNTEVNDGFGASVDVSGDTVVVGASGEDSGAAGVNGNQADNGARDSGAAYVFVHSGGVWSQQAYIKASNTGVNDFFGFAVAISADTLVVGALYEDSNATGVNGNQGSQGNPDSGAAYVFVRSGGIWSQQAYLKASNPGWGDLFGHSVAVSGATVVAGALFEDSSATGVNGNQADNSAPDSGAANVFTGFTAWITGACCAEASCVITTQADCTDGTWLLGEVCEPFSPCVGACCLTMGGCQLTLEQECVQNGLGVFRGAGTRCPPPPGDCVPAGQQAYLKASNTNVGDFFGWSVAVSGDTVVIGARSEGSSATGVNGNQADNSAADSGAAYVFVRSGGVWSQQAYLKASNTDASDRFGAEVAISGDTVVVGASGEDSAATGVNGNQADNSASDSGAVYVFVRSGGIWSQQAYLKASNSGVNDGFGASVDVSGDTVVVGASGEDSGAADSGAAYVFVRSGGGWSQQAYLKASNTDASDQFGAEVAVSGDTVVVGASGEDSNAMGVNGNQADNGATGSGAGYVFVRSGGVWSQQAYLKASNSGVNDGFGASVDVSGDTVVVGAPEEDSNATGVNCNQADNSAVRSGAAYVFVRSGGVWSQQAYLKASNSEGVGGGGFSGGDFFGSPVAVSGDTVVVGARNEDSSATGVNGNQADNSGVESGAAYVFVRSAGVWTQQAYLKASNTGQMDLFGHAVAVNGDTVLVGAFFEASGATGVNGNQADKSAIASGAAYVFIGVGSTLRGDMDCNGFVAVGDIGGFVLALTDPAQYATQFPSCDIYQADVNRDGFVTVADIGEFVGLLTGR